MNRSLLLSFLLLAPLAASCQNDNKIKPLVVDKEVTEYYSAAKGLCGSSLKTAFCSIIYNRSEQDYSELWQAFFKTDVRADGTISDIYSAITSYTPVVKGTNYKREGDCYNREHSFPTSWFGGKILPMYTDLHHIYPTDGYVNSRRGNRPFGQTEGEVYKSQQSFSKLGACTYAGYSGLVFEPNDEYKGDLARTYFYMVTCYEFKLPDWYVANSGIEGLAQTLDGTTYPSLSSWQLEMLMKWAAADPVSKKEIERNNAIYDIQHNRNPFIDYPGLEQYIWGELKDKPFDATCYVK